MKGIVCIIGFVLFTLPATVLHAQVAGPNSPAGHIIMGSGTWLSNGSGFYALDNNMAYADLGAYPLCSSQGSYQCYYSQVAMLTGFGFSIPATAVIDGIKVEVSKKVGQPVSDIRDSVIRLEKAGIPTGSNYALATQWPMSFTYFSYGGATDLWNAALTPADVNDPTFGLVLQLTNGLYDQTAQIDHVQITVYYSAAAAIHEINTSSMKPVLVNSGLSFINCETNQPVKLTICDIMGRKIMDVEHYSFQTLDISSLSAGIYTIRLSSSTFNVSRKIVVQN